MNIKSSQYFTDIEVSCFALYRYVNLLIKDHKARDLECKHSKIYRENLFQVQEKAGDPLGWDKIQKINAVTPFQACV